MIVTLIMITLKKKKDKYQRLVNKEGFLRYGYMLRDGKVYDPWKAAHGKGLMRQFCIT